MRFSRLPAASLLTATLLATSLSPMAAGEATVTVHPGDTLTAIAARHGVPIPEIVRLNGLNDANRIYAGQVLRLAPTPGGQAAAPPAPAAPQAQVHVIQAGENLTSIARRYATSVEALAAANALSNPSRIFAGQRLTIPSTAKATSATTASAPAAASAAAPTAQVHVVKAGENLTWIARRYGTTVPALATANALADPSRIFAGQRLTIPGSATAATAQPATTSAMPAKMAALVAKRGEVGAMIAEEARRFDVPVAFARALAWQESGWQSSVVSSSGAVGVMQLLPATGTWVSQSMLGEPVKLGDTRSNIRAGMALLAFYLDRYDGDKRLVLAAYYQGMTAADRHGVYPVSQPYIASILALERLFAAN